MSWQSRYNEYTSFWTGGRPEEFVNCLQSCKDGVREGVAFQAITYATVMWAYDGIKSLFD